MKDICQSCKQWYEHVYWEHNDSKGVSFLKIMGTADFSQGMSMPEKFMARFKEELSTIIDLKDPSGILWHVGLKKTSAGVFLRNGWKEFAEAHHLEESDVLVFKYQGNSCFSVTLFDSSGCEKEASYFAQNKPEQKTTKEPSLKIREKARVWEVYDSSEESEESDDQSEESICLRSKAKKSRLSPKRENESIYGDQPENVNLSRMPASCQEESAAMQLARAFTPIGPSFLKEMRGYNVRTQFQLLVPSDYADKFLPRENKVIILRLPNTKKEWKVHYSVNRSSSRFLGKWRTFVGDNNLKEGDVCVFELSGSKEQIAMIVHIFCL